MQTLWFILVALMLTTYILLDGFDLGAGVIHLFVARNDQERRTILRAIGPVWDGNEVWLSPPEARCSSPSPYSMPPVSAGSTCP